MSINLRDFLKLSSAKILNEKNEDLLKHLPAMEEALHRIQSQHVFLEKIQDGKAKDENKKVAEGEFQKKGGGNVQNEGNSIELSQEVNHVIAKLTQFTQPTSLSADNKSLLRQIIEAHKNIQKDPQIQVQNDALIQAQKDGNFIQQLIQALFEQKYYTIIEEMLRIASNIGYYGCVMYILDENINQFLPIKVNAKDTETGETALHYCLQGNSFEHLAIAHRLLQAGADMDTKAKIKYPNANSDIEELSPLEIAQKKMLNGDSNSEYFLLLFYGAQQTRIICQRATRRISPDNPSEKSSNSLSNDKNQGISTENAGPTEKTASTENAGTTENSQKKPFIDRVILESSISNRLIKYTASFSKYIKKEEPISGLPAKLIDLLVPNCVIPKEIDNFLSFIVPLANKFISDIEASKHNLWRINYVREERFSDIKYRSSLFMNYLWVQVEIMRHHRTMIALLESIRHDIFNWLDLNINNTYKFSLMRKYNSLIFESKRNLLKTYRTKIGLMSRCFKYCFREDYKDSFQNFYTKEFTFLLDEYFPGDKLNLISFIFQSDEKFKKQNATELDNDELNTKEMMNIMKLCNTNLNTRTKSIAKYDILPNPLLRRTLDDVFIGHLSDLFYRTMSTTYFIESTEALKQNPYLLVYHIVESELNFHAYKEKAKEYKDKYIKAIDLLSLETKSVGQNLDSSKNKILDFNEAMLTEEELRKKEFNEEQERILCEQEYEKEQERRAKRKLEEEQRKREQEKILQKAKAEKEKLEKQNLLIGKIFKELYPEDKHEKDINLLKEILEGKIKKMPVKDFLAMVKQLKIKGSEDIQSDNLTMHGNSITLVLGEEGATLHSRHGRDRILELDYNSVKNFKKMINGIGLNETNFEANKTKFFEKLDSITRELNKVKQGKPCLLSSAGGEAVAVNKSETAVVKKSEKVTVNFTIVTPNKTTP